MTDIWNDLSLKTGDLELKILPGIGGRLWDIIFRNTSLLFQNPDLLDLPVDLAGLTDLPTRSPQYGFPLWGGEKTWIAPDRDWPNGAPYPVLDSAPYDVVSANDDQIEMRSAECPVSRLQITRLIAIERPGEWRIEHKVRNCGAAPRTAGIWSVMMLNHPTTMRIDRRQAGAISSVFGDHARFVKETDAELQIACATQGEFKLGVDLLSCKIDLLFRSDDGTARLQCDTPTPRASDTFAHGHNFEVFNSGDYPYCEAEWHSPAVCLSPGKDISFTQRFRVSADHSLSD